MKYELSTLLALRQDACIDMTKFTVHAIENDLLGCCKANMNVLVERPGNSSHRASSISFSQSGERPGTPGERTQHPGRQPNDPPHGTLAQTDVGFARFLKEHASPKHHRVTAGGRIVPMMPNAPAPQFKLSGRRPEGGSLMEGCRSGTQSRDKDDAVFGALGVQEPGGSFTFSCTSIESPFTKPTSSGKASTMEALNKLGRQDQVSSPQPCFQPSNAMRGSPLAEARLSFLASNTQPIQEEETIRGFPPFPQNNAGCHNGIDWSPAFSQPPSVQRHIGPSGSLAHQYMTEPATPLRVTAGNVHRPFPSVGDVAVLNNCSTTDFNGTPGITATYPIAPRSLSPLGGFENSTAWPPLQEIIEEYETLSAQLATLDRYMALRTFHLDPSSKKLLVAQRMELVREMDAKRQFKEQLESVLGQQDAGILNAQMTQPSSLQAPFFQFCSENLPRQQDTPRLSWTPALNANSYPSLWANPTIPTSQTAVPSENGSRYGGVSFQFPEMGSVTSLPAGFGYGQLLTCDNIPYESSNSARTVNRYTGDNNNLRVFHGGTPGTGEVPYANGGWPIPKEATPPGIVRVYRKIEKAVQCGQPVDTLLKELAAVVEKSSRHAESVKFKSQQGQAAFSHGNDIGEMGTSLSKKDTPRFSKYTGESGSGRSCFMSQDDKEGSSSNLSTLGSWTTVRELKKLIPPNGGACDRRGEKDSSTSRAKFYRNGRAGDSRGGSDAAPVNVASHVPDIHKKTKWVPKANQPKSKDSLGNYISGEIKKGPSAPRKHKGGGTDVLPQQVRTSVISLADTYGFLPAFDGAGDILNSAEPRLHSTLKVEDGTSHAKTSGSELNHKSYIWCDKVPRERPGSDEVLEFFKQIEIKEAAMIEKYHMGQQLYNLGSASDHELDVILADDLDEGASPRISKKQKGRELVHVS